MSDQPVIVTDLSITFPAMLRLVLTLYAAHVVALAVISATAIVAGGAMAMLTISIGWMVS